MQATHHILVIRPANFAFNAETAVNNSFQTKLEASEDTIKHNKLLEFEAFVAKLKTEGVDVLVVDDTVSPEKPDAIFPNNWISFHADGTVILYPMYAANRRHERRTDIIDLIKQQFTVTKIHDLSGYEKENRFLEGTGSIIFDHIHKIAYACLSPRTDKDLFVEVCSFLNYKPVYFFARDAHGKEIYHTNVMMCVAEKYAVICLESITNATEKESVIQSLSQTGHEIIDISIAQMNCFAGNMLELKTSKNTSILAMSQTAFNSLNSVQKDAIEKHSALVPLPIKTIETIGGGSARCMIAEIFLPELS